MRLVKQCVTNLLRSHVHSDLVRGASRTLTMLFFPFSLRIERGKKLAPLLLTFDSGFVNSASGGMQLPAFRPRFGRVFDEATDPP